MGGSTGLIKGEAAAEHSEGLYPGYSASGQDVWLERPTHRGDGLVLSAVGARCGKVFDASGAWGVVANTVPLRPQTGQDRRFLWYLVNREDFWEKGGAAQPYVRVQDTLERRLPIPVHATEVRISRFLDTETARIDALIAKKRQMADLVAERWSVELSDALGSEPGLRLKRLLAAPLAYGVLVPRHREGDGVPMLRIMDLVATGVDLASVARIPVEQSAEYKRTKVCSGDLVVSVVGTLGRSIEITPELEGCNLNRPLARVQLQLKVPRNLIRLWFESARFRDQALLATSSDSAQPTLGLGDLKNFVVGLSEDRSNWCALAAHLEARHSVVVRTKEMLGRHISLLAEHRQALITAAVTGELEVTGVAA